MLDSVDLFRRGFEPIDGGYLYFPSRWSSGYLITAEEYETLATDWQRASGTAGMFKIAGVAVTLIVLAMLASYLFKTDIDGPAALVIGIGVGAYLVWRSTAANRLVRGREPVRPPRSSREAEAAMGRTLGRPLAALMVVISLSFVVSGIQLAQTIPLLGIPMAIVFAIAAFFNGRLAVRAFRSRD